MTTTLRDYRPGDASATLAVFVAAVTETAAADYSPEQIAAWARPEQRSLTEWAAARAAAATVVAESDGVVVGFTDVDPDGYVDMMFVAPSAGGRGVGRALLGHVEERARAAGTRELTASVSVTARPFFERLGFAVVEEREPVVGGIALTNFRMRKPLEVELRGELVCADAAQAAVVAHELPRHAELSRAEPGCLAFDVTPTTDPLVWRVAERFATRADFAAHQTRVAASGWGRATAGIERRYEVAGLGVPAVPASNAQDRVN